MASSDILITQLIIFERPGQGAGADGLGQNKGVAYLAP